jgi:hypothetical protein
MRSAGVRFRNLDSPDLPLPNQWPFLAAVFAAGAFGTIGFESRHYFDEMRYLWSEMLREEQQKRIAPQVQIALDLLRSRHGNADPFASYPVGRTPATPELRELIKQHQLPNGARSPWLDFWLKGLEGVPESWKPLPRTTDAGSQWAMRSADSTIKRNLDQAISPSESWAIFLQRLFEREWAQRIGAMAGEANKKSGVEVWSAAALFALIQQTVSSLNVLGYELTAPAEGRLKVLLDRATEGKPLYYASDDW